MYQPNNFKMYHIGDRTKGGFHVPQKVGFMYPTGRVHVPHFNSSPFPL